MIHPLVLQLRFTRSEFKRALDKISEQDARRRVEPVNCVSWTVGHLAWQEQRYFLYFVDGTILLPKIQELYRYGAAPSTPPLTEMWRAWRKITKAADEWLDTVTTKTLQQHVVRDGKKTDAQFGNLLQRVIYHYWYHTGENMAVRKILGHKKLGVFVGDIDTEAPYTPERSAGR